MPQKNIRMLTKKPFLMQPAIKKNILVFNLATNEHDPILGFTVALLGRIARDARSVSVITVSAGAHSLPSNVSVRSIGREKGRNRIAAIFVFYWHLFSVLRSARPDICFAHMNSLFVVLAGPILWIRGIPIIVWHSHRNRGITMRIAHYFAWRILTSVAEGYASTDSKVVIVGQMIDTDVFSPVPAQVRISPPLFISVGRIAPIKNLEIFIRAAAFLRDAGYDFKCACIGPVLLHDTPYAAFLMDEVSRYSLEDIFFLKGPIQHQRMASEYRRALAHINVCVVGSLDKAPIEAMACGTPSVVANTAYRSLLGRYANELIFDAGNPESLAAILASLLTAPTHAISAMRTELRTSVAAHASMDSFMRQFWEVVGLCEQEHKISFK